MRSYIILIGLTPWPQAEPSNQFVDILKTVFSLGPAWHGNQQSILLKSDLSSEQIVQRIAPLVGPMDLVGVMEISMRSMTTIGQAADEESLEALYPDILKVEGKLKK